VPLVIGSKADVEFVASAILEFGNSPDTSGERRMRGTIGR